MAIELDHSFAVPVPPEKAWDVLLDVARVAPCMPGATVDEVDGDVVTGKIRVKVGPISMTYSGKATFTDKDEAAHAVKVEAAGKETRGAGTASATVQARLEDDNGQTRVSVHTSLNVTGRPAQFGRGVMAEVGGRLIEKFSANLAEQLAAGDAGSADGGSADAPSGAAGRRADGGSTGSGSTGSGGAGGSGSTGGSGTGGDGAGGSGAGEPATAPAGGPAGSAAGSPAGPDARLGIPLQELNLTVRSFNSLKSEGIDTVGQLVARTPGDLLGIKNIGERSVEEIEEKLRDLGLGLAQAPQQVTAAANGAPPAASAPASGSQAPGGQEERAVWDGGAAAAAPAGRPDEDDAIDLLDVAAGPVLKRVLPAAGAAIVLIVVGFRLRRRLRSR
jgi:carbon monoxide dehydrogenase subunit G